MMNMVTGMSTIYLNITVENIEDNLQVFELLRHVKPSWLLENLEYKRFDSGIVNEMRLYFQRSDITLDDAVMVRVYGDGLGDANPRDTEFLALQIAHAVDCFPTLHASFQNGLVYEYIKGRVPTFKDLLKPAIITDITSKIYRLNHVDLESLRLFARNGQPAKYDEKSDLFSRMRLYINQIPTEVEETDRNDRFQSFRQDFTNEKLLQELEFIKHVYEEVQMPIMFTHGDLHLRNMVLNDESHEVMFIDFETTGFSYGCWDLSYLLSSRQLFEAVGWADKSEPRLTEATRLLYIKGYLAAMFKSLGKEADQISDLDIEFMDLQLKLVDLSIYHNFMVVGLALVMLPGADSLSLIPVSKQHYISLKQSIKNIKERYVELKKVPSVMFLCRSLGHNFLKS